MSASENQDNGCSNGGKEQETYLNHEILRTLTTKKMGEIESLVSDIEAFKSDDRDEMVDENVLRIEAELFDLINTQITETYQLGTQIGSMLSEIEELEYSRELFVETVKDFCRQTEKEE